MFFEVILNINAVLVLGAPLLFLVLFVSGFSLPREEFICSLAIGFVSALVGCVWITPVDPGTLGIGVIMYLFEAPWWFSIGYMAVCLYFSFGSNRKNRFKYLMLTFFLFVIIFRILTHTYAFYASSKSYSIIQGYLRGTVSESELTKNGHQKTKHFRTAVLHYLDYDQDELGESQIRFLANRGFDVYECKSLPREMIDNALYHYENNSLDSAGLSMNFIGSLALNPSLTLHDYERFVQKEEMITWFHMLVANPQFDEDRYKIVRGALEASLRKNSLPENQNQTAQDEIKLRIEKIDEIMKRKKKSP